MAHMKLSEAMNLAPCYLQPPETKQEGKTDRYRIRGPGVISSTCESFLMVMVKFKSAVKAGMSKSDLRGSRVALELV